MQECLIGPDMTVDNCAGRVGRLYVWTVTRPPGLRSAPPLLSSQGQDALGDCSVRGLRSPSSFSPPRCNREPLRSVPVLVGRLHRHEVSLVACGPAAATEPDPLRPVLAAVAALCEPQPGFKVATVSTVVESPL